MPHIDITMIPGRNDSAKKEKWTAHMENIKDKKLFVSPGV